MIDPREVQTEVCPVCRTVHDKPLCPPQGQPLAETVIESVMVKINGKSFRCHCGANVFHHPDPDDRALYECNGCGEHYHGE